MVGTCSLLAPETGEKYLGLSLQNFSRKLRDVGVDKNKTFG